MKFAHAASILSDAEDAAEQVSSEVLTILDSSVDLAVLMCTHAYRGQYDHLLERIRKILAPGSLIGCTGGGILGGGMEIEEGPSVTLLAAHLPNVEVVPFCLAADHLMEFSVVDNLRNTGIPLDSGPRTLILLADPFSAPPDTLMDAINEVCPGWSVAGGMASGADQEGENRLFFGDWILGSGMVGLAISGNIHTRTLVSQGCRPIGKPYVITNADRNIIYTLGGVPALDCVREVYEAESDEVRELLSSGLMVGHVVDERKETFERGDFLVRNVMIFHEESGAVVTGDFFRSGQTIQFHVRDDRTAIEDLETMCQRVRQEGFIPAAGLCFSCNSRGTQMFGESNRESSSIFKVLGEFPMVGHFAAGEFGDVGGKAFLHGHSLSLALFMGEGQE